MNRSYGHRCYVPSANTVTSYLLPIGHHRRLRCYHHLVAGVAVGCEVAVVSAGFSSTVNVATRQSRLCAWYLYHTQNKTPKTHETNTHASDDCIHVSCKFRCCFGFVSLFATLTLARWFWNHTCTIRTDSPVSLANDSRTCNKNIVYIIHSLCWTKNQIIGFINSKRTILMATKAYLGSQSKQITSNTDLYHTLSRSGTIQLGEGRRRRTCTIGHTTRASSSQYLTT